MTEVDSRYDLIEACKKGNAFAQKQLYEQYADAMYNVCYRMVQNHPEAQDLLQNAFIDVYRNLHKFQYQSTPGAWIKRIVINKCLDFFRAKKLDYVDVEDQHIKELPDTEIEENLLSVEAIKSAMQTLSEGYRTVLSLYLFEGYDHAEIAEVLQISVSTSKTQYHRAKKKLRKLLLEHKVAC